MLAELQTSNERVREIFHHLIASGTAAPAVNLDIFADPPRATRALNELAQGSVSFHVAPRTRQIFRRLRPLLLEQLAQCADPDATLVAIVRFVEAFGLRSLLFELLATNPKLLELLVRTFDASFFATNVLIRHPHLLGGNHPSATLNHSLSLSEHTAALHPLVERGDLDSIRVYRQTQLLRTIMRDVSRALRSAGFVAGNYRPRGSLSSRRCCNCGREQSDDHRDGKIRGPRADLCL